MVDREAVLGPSASGSCKLTNLSWDKGSSFGTIECRTGSTIKQVWLFSIWQRYVPTAGLDLIQTDGIIYKNCEARYIIPLDSNGTMAYSPLPALLVVAANEFFRSNRKWDFVRDCMLFISAWMAANSKLRMSSRTEAHMPMKTHTYLPESVVPEQL